jgi:hypothetical protein
MTRVLEWEQLSAGKMTVPEHVVFRDLAQETVLLNVDSGRYHSIDRIGARFFAVLRDAAEVGDAVRPLAAEFGQPADVIERDLAAFCNQLLESDLVQIEPQGAAAV